MGIWNFLAHLDPLVNLLVVCVYNEKYKSLAPDMIWVIWLRKGAVILQTVQRLERLVEFI